MITSHGKEYFFKYVTASVAKSILENLKVKCGSVFLFNDPFDSQITISHDVENKEIFIQRINKLICTSLEPILRNKDVANAEAALNARVHQKDDFVSKRYEAFLNFYNEINTAVSVLLATDRVFCVSEIHDNLLMWAHYADEHKGAVIKLKCIPGASALCNAKPIRYSPMIPLLNVEDLFADKNEVIQHILNNILLTKSIDWSYEKEWRIILGAKDNSKGFDYRGIGEDELDSIYLGCRMSKEDKVAIINCVKSTRSNIKIFESKKSCSEFKLDFTEISS